MNAQQRRRLRRSETAQGARASEETERYRAAARDAVANYEREHGPVEPVILSAAELNDVERWRAMGNGEFIGALKAEMGSWGQPPAPAF